MRRPIFTASFEDLLPGEVVVDCFAGGGGAGEGIRRAIQRPVDIAINHSPTAIAMYQANHPETRTYCEDIYQVDPREACAGRRCGVAWFSPECTNHSRAKGGKPRDEQSRTTGDVVLRWAREVRPRVLVCENVEEWEDWGPLDEHGKPDKTRLGETFRAWCAALTDLGYDIEIKTLVAADYGAPTSRKRLFVIARCDGAPKVWPEPTHGPGRAEPWKPAADVIDWSIPCHSIFLTNAEGKKLGVKRPLADATLQRIAAGLRKFVFDAADPFIIPLTHQGDRRAHSIHEPVRTITGANRGELALVEPFIVRHGHYSTITGAGLREGCGAGLFRGQQLTMPLATVCATNDKHLVVPIIAKGYGGPNGHQTPGQDARTPLGSVTTKDHHQLAVAWLTKMYGSAKAGASVRLPMPTVTAGGGRGGGHVAQCMAFLTKYYSGGQKAKDAQQQSLFDPVHTVTTKARFGLVVIHGIEYQLVDIGIRMLQPHELFAAQGFPPDYDITCERTFGKPLTKTQQTELAGNAVPPQWSHALVAANIGGERRIAA